MQTENINEPKKLGRPRVQEKKDTFVNVPFTKKDRSRVVDLANKKGLSIGSLMRSIILAEIGRIESEAMREVA